MAVQRSFHSYASLILCGIVFSILLATSSPSITWWNSGNYAAAGYTLGIPGPSESIVYVVLLRVFSMIFFFLEPVKAMVLLSVVCASLSSLFFYRGLHNLLSFISGGRTTTAVRLASFCTAISLPLLRSIWSYGVVIDAYIVGLLFTSVLFWVVVTIGTTSDDHTRWRYWLLACFIVSLDFCAHRMNLPALPLFPILLVYPLRKLLCRPGFWITTIMICILGLSLHMYLLMRTAAHPTHDMGFIQNWADLIAWIRMERFGEPLLPDILNRRAPFWEYQIRHMYLRYLGWNFMGNPHLILPVLPLLFAIIGILWTCIKRWRIAALLSGVYACYSLFLVIYLNIWNNFFREIDRLFLPSFLVFLIWTGIGLWVVCAALITTVRSRKLSRSVSVSIIVGIITGALLMPVGLFLSNKQQCSRAGYTHADDYARSTLEGCAKNAILFTFGDNDTYPLFYGQNVAGVRRDITVINLSLLNLVSYTRYLCAVDTLLQRLIPASLVDTVKPSKNFLVRDSVWKLPQSNITVRQPGSSKKWAILVADKLLLRIIDQNCWRRPVYFSSAANLPFSLDSSTFCCGFASVLTPARDTDSLFKQLEHNILTVYRYGPVDKRFASDYDADEISDIPRVFTLPLLRRCFTTLLQHRLQRSEYTQSKTILERMDQHLPSWYFTKEEKTSFNELRSAVARGTGSSSR
ncbi:MAG: DUF2723 domain-containing protein [Chitinivibrionales bacterium]|nr:DUF2723 domain-containing protein [Chitinivibrionales bacterium]